MKVVFPKGYQFAGPTGSGGPMTPPPSANGEGSGDVFLAREDARFAELSDRVGQTPYQLYDLALSNILRARDAFTTQSESAVHLHAATISISSAIASDAPHMPVSELEFVLSGMYLLGWMTFSNTVIDPAQANTLFRATSQLSATMEKYRATYTPYRRFVHDLTLSEIGILAKCDFNQDALQEPEMRSFSDAVCRIALVSGTRAWQNLGTVQQAYAGLNASDIDGITFHRPAHYFDLVWRWRPRPLGYLEYVLATSLDHSLKTARRLCGNALTTHSDYPVAHFEHHDLFKDIHHALHQTINRKGSKQMALASIMDIVMKQANEDLIPPGSLPHFLNTTVVDS